MAYLFELHLYVVEIGKGLGSRIRNRVRVQIIFEFWIGFRQWVGVFLSSGSGSGLGLGFRV